MQMIPPYHQYDSDHPHPPSTPSHSRRRSRISAPGHSALIVPITPRIFGERGKRRASALGIDPERLPPGQSPPLKWPVLSVGATPRVDRTQWILSIDGAVDEPYVLDWEKFLAEPQTDWTGDIHCVTRWSKFGMQW